MLNTDQKLLDCLDEIKGSGSFACMHTRKFTFPDFEIKGFGELSYPIPEFQAKSLIGIARKAPFGKGHQTIVDTDVRSAMEIDAENIFFKGDNWNKFLLKALSDIQTDLGIEYYEIEAHLYKLLIYAKGDFFLTHKDSEKEKGMFGTMIVALPSKHTGGELIVNFDGENKSIQFDKDCSEGKIPYAAFYADCDHEIKPLESGYRVVLVYNLIQKNNADKLIIESIGTHISNLKSALKEEEKSNEEKPKIILLGHQYTPENFSREHLKLNDRAKAEALLRAAKEAGFYANLCLVTSCVSGVPEYDGYVDDYEDSEMGEVFDEWIKIEKWLDDTNPGLSNFSIQEDDLLATFELNEEEPLIKESEGYMGNYGPELTFWYHYGAVILWSKKTHLNLIDSQSISNQLEWLNYYNLNRNALDSIERDICSKIILNLKNNQNNKVEGDFNFIVEWFRSEKNLKEFELSGFELLEKYFNRINAVKWEGLIETYGNESIEKFFLKLSQSISKTKVASLLNILHFLSDRSELKSFIENQLRLMPKFYSELASNQDADKPLINPTALGKLLKLESKFPQTSDWVSEISNTLLVCKSRNYLKDTLANVLLSTLPPSKLGNALLMKCKNEFQQRADNKPQPPANWTRSMPVTGQYKKQWNILESFMDSPEEYVFDYRKLQAERNEMSDAISREDVDLSMETIKKGSPHLLRITKNNNSFERDLKVWKEDCEILVEIKEKT